MIGTFVLGADGRYCRSVVPGKSHPLRRGLTIRRLLMVGWLLSCALLIAWIFVLARYIWAPLPDYCDPDFCEGQGEGLALIISFYPGIIVFVVLIVVPGAYFLTHRRKALGVDEEKRPL